MVPFAHLCSTGTAKPLLNSKPMSRMPTRVSPTTKSLSPNLHSRSRPVAKLISTPFVAASISLEVNHHTLFSGSLSSSRRSPSWIPPPMLRCTSRSSRRRRVFSRPMTGTVPTLLGRVRRCIITTVRLVLLASCCCRRRTNSLHSFIRYNQPYFIPLL